MIIQRRSNPIAIGAEAVSWPRTRLMRHTVEFWVRKSGHFVLQDGTVASYFAMSAV